LEFCLTLLLYFKIAETQESAEEIETYQRYKYPTMSKTQGNFKLTVVEGEFTDSQIVVMLGENGTGKTTFIRMLVMPSLLASLSDMFIILSSGKKSCVVLYVILESFFNLPYCSEEHSCYLAGIYHWLYTVWLLYSSEMRLSLCSTANCHMNTSRVDLLCAQMQRACPLPPANAAHLNMSLLFFS
jgi:hypothetical protein